MRKHKIPYDNKCLWRPVLGVAGIVLFCFSAALLLPKLTAGFQEAGIGMKPFYNFTLPLYLAAAGIVFFLVIRLLIESSPSFSGAVIDAIIEAFAFSIIVFLLMFVFLNIPVFLLYSNLGSSDYYQPQNDDVMSAILQNWQIMLYCLTGSILVFLCCWQGFGIWPRGTRAFLNHQIASFHLPDKLIDLSYSYDMNGKRITESSGIEQHLGKLYCFGKKGNSLIVGNSGYGKSTCVKRSVKNYARRLCHFGRIPVYAPAVDLSEVSDPNQNMSILLSSPKAQRRWLSRVLSQSEHLLDFDGAESFLNKIMVKRNRLVFLIDGINEMPNSDNEKLLSMLQRITQENSCVFVSCPINATNARKNEQELYLTFHVNGVLSSLLAGEDARFSEIGSSPFFYSQLKAKTKKTAKGKATANADAKGTDNANAKDTENVNAKDTENVNAKGTENVNAKDAENVNAKDAENVNAKGTDNADAKDTDNANAKDTENTVYKALESMVCSALGKDDSDSELLDALGDAAMAAFLGKKMVNPPFDLPLKEEKTELLLRLVDSGVLKTAKADAAAQAPGAQHACFRFSHQKYWEYFMARAALRSSAKSIPDAVSFYKTGKIASDAHPKDSKMDSVKHIVEDAYLANVYAMFIDNKGLYGELFPRSSQETEGLERTEDIKRTADLISTEDLKKILHYFASHFENVTGNAGIGNTCKNVKAGIADAMDEFAADHLRNASFDHLRDLCCINHLLPDTWKDRLFQRVFIHEDITDANDIILQERLLDNYCTYEDTYSLKIVKRDDSSECLCRHFIEEYPNDLLIRREKYLDKLLKSSPKTLLSAKGFLNLRRWCIHITTLLYFVLLVWLVSCLFTSPFAAVRGLLSQIPNIAQNGASMQEIFVHLFGAGEEKVSNLVLPASKLLALGLFIGSFSAWLKQLSAPGDVYLTIFGNAQNWFSTDEIINILRRKSPGDTKAGLRSLLLIMDWVRVRPSVVFFAIVVLSMMWYPQFVSLPIAPVPLCVIISLIFFFPISSLIYLIILSKSKDKQNFKKTALVSIVVQLILFMLLTVLVMISIVCDVITASIVTAIIVALLVIAAIILGVFIICRMIKEKKFIKDIEEKVKKDTKMEKGLLKALNEGRIEGIPEIAGESDNVGTVSFRCTRELRVKLESIASREEQK